MTVTLIIRLMVMELICDGDLSMWQHLLWTSVNSDTSRWSGVKSSTLVDCRQPGKRY